MHRAGYKTRITPTDICAPLALVSLVLSLVLAATGNETDAYKVLLAGSAPLILWLSLVVCHWWGGAGHPG